MTTFFNLFSSADPSSEVTAALLFSLVLDSPPNSDGVAFRAGCRDWALNSLTCSIPGSFFPFVRANIDSE